MSTSKDRRFLHTPPYAWEIGVAAAAVAAWKLLSDGRGGDSGEPRDAVPPLAGKRAVGEDVAVPGDGRD